MSPKSFQHHHQQWVAHKFCDQFSSIATPAATAQPLQSAQDLQNLLNPLIQVQLHQLQLFQNATTMQQGATTQEEKKEEKDTLLGISDQEVRSLLETCDCGYCYLLSVSFVYLPCLHLHVHHTISPPAMNCLYLQIVVRCS